MGVFESSAAVRYRFAARECLTLGIHDELSFGQEFVDHVDGYIQDAARIASQVDDVFFCIFVFQLGETVHEFGVGRTSEFVYLYVSGLGIDHKGNVYAVYGNVVAGYFISEHFGRSGSQDAQFYLASFGPA